ncbi:hypothetical protein ABZZ04_21130 [Streptomyces sp. NPDC006435]|uniref:hypothetical protein n=1 Tax=Streptomyces sp. NPDC006435 TaxID=3154300 RepID=UPI0033A20F3B
MPDLLRQYRRGGTDEVLCLDPAGTPTFDARPETGRARLPCRRAEEIFEENTRPPPRLTRRHRGPGTAGRFTGYGPVP